MPNWKGAIVERSCKRVRLWKVKPSAPQFCFAFCLHFVSTPYHCCRCIYAWRGRFQRLPERHRSDVINCQSELLPGNGAFLWLTPPPPWEFCWLPRFIIDVTPLGLNPRHTHIYTNIVTTKAGNCILSLEFAAEEHQLRVRRCTWPLIAKAWSRTSTFCRMWMSAVTRLAELWSHDTASYWLYITEVDFLIKPIIYKILK